MMDDYPTWPDLFRWLNVLKDRVETIPAIGAEQIVTGTLNPDLIPPIPWADVLKAGSSLGDLETRSATDLTSGILAATRLPAFSGDASSDEGTSVLTLATVNALPGSFGSGTAIPIVTVNGKGLVTAVLEQPIQTGALTRVNDTNVTLTLGGTPETALLQDVSLTLGWSGTLGVTRGGTGTGTAFTAGSVIFAGASGIYAQDNANLFWDDTNNRLGLGTALPRRRLHVADGTGEPIAAMSPGGVQVIVSGSGSSGSIAGIVANNTIAHFPGLYLRSIRARGTLAVPTTALDGDLVALWEAEGYDGSARVQLANIGMFVETAAGMSGYMTFLTSPNTATGAVERVRIDSTGKVGIGTTSPGALLDLLGAAPGISNSTKGLLNVYTNDSQAADKGGSLTLGGYITGTSTARNFAGIAGRKENGTSGNEAGYLSLFTNNAGTFTERVHIASNGNVGLSQSNPNIARLHVTGDSNTDPLSAGIALQDLRSGSGATYTLRSDAGEFFLRNHTASAVVFRVDSNNRIAVGSANPAVGGGAGTLLLANNVSLNASNAAANAAIQLIFADGSNVVQVANSKLSITSGGNASLAGTLTLGGVANLKNYTVATLPAGTRGDIAYVTDALAPAFLVAIAGGGAVVTPVFFDGANWVAY